MLSACQGNNADEELGPTQVSKDPDSSVPDPTNPDPTDPEPTDPEPTDPEPTDPEPTDPEPTDPDPTDPDPTVACVTSHSGSENNDYFNSRADFLFYATFSTGKLQSYEVASNARANVGETGTSTATFPFLSISGTTLATQRGLYNGEWLFETNTEQLIFKDTLLGTARQVSSLKTGGYQICSMTQIKPSIERMSEFYINYGSSCALTSKVNLAMSANEDAITIPNAAITEGIALYDGDANWLGQLYKVVENNVAKLVLQKSDFCSQNDLVTFSSTADAWTAKQYPDGSLLLQIGAKIYNLTATDVLAWVADEASFSLPEEALITLPNADQVTLFDKNESNIFYTNLSIVEDSESKLNVINNAEVFVFNLAGGDQPAALSLYSAGESDKSILGFEKLELDDDSLWLETQFTTESVDEIRYNRRYSRVDLSSKALDTSAKFDYQLKQINQKTEWHSIGNKVYLKANKNTGIFQALASSGEKDYLLQAGVAARVEDKVWHFIKQDSAINKKADAVIAWDYSKQADDELRAELIDADSTTAFPKITRQVRALVMASQFADRSLFWELSCTLGCGDGESISQYEYRVSSLKYSDGSLMELYRETCDTTDTEPQSQTCVVN
jgi:hypothetical protein